MLRARSAHREAAARAGRGIAVAAFADWLADDVGEQRLDEFAHFGVIPDGLREGTGFSLDVGVVGVFVQGGDGAQIGEQRKGVGEALLGGLLARRGGVGSGEGVGGLLDDALGFGGGERGTKRGKKGVEHRHIKAGEVFARTAGKTVKGVRLTDAGSHACLFDEPLGEKVFEVGAHGVVRELEVSGKVVDGRRGGAEPGDKLASRGAEGRRKVLRHWATPALEKNEDSLPSYPVELKVKI
jgi:hypothetical protein